MDNEKLEQIFDFLFTVNNLKFTYRYSDRVFLNKESSAAHSWRLSLLVILIAPEINLSIDVLKATKIAIIHDIPEAIVGDTDRVKVIEGKESETEKEKKELEAMKDLRIKLPENLGKEIFDLWLDYFKAGSLEAKLVKALDKIECQLHLLQKMPESLKGYELAAEVAYEYADKHVEKIPDLKNMVEIIKNKFIESGIELPKK